MSVIQSVQSVQSVQSIQYVKKIEHIPDNIYYDTLITIDNLFNKKKYRSRIGAKLDNNTKSQTIVYYNPIDITEAYTIKINNEYNIEVIIPIKKSNFTYKSLFTNPRRVLDFLIFHLGS